MKILQVQGQSGEGGAEVHTFLLSRGLIERGHEIFLAAPDTPSTAISRAEDAGCRMLRFTPVPAWRGLLDVANGVRLARLVRAEGIELIHAHIWYGDVISVVASMLTGVPVVTTIHGPYVRVSLDRKPIHELHRVVYKGFLTRMERIIAISQFVKDLAVRDLRLDPAKVDVVHNCSDVSLYQEPRDVARIRAELGVERKHVVIAIVGELSERKGIPEFVEAAAIIARACPEARFLLVGDGHLRASAESQAQKRGCREAMIFTGWRKDIPDLMAASDILAVTSYLEGFGRTITEAMSSAKPVIAYDSGAPREIIFDTETGFLVREGDVDGFARHGIRLVQDAGLRRRMGEAGLARARAEFDIPRFVDKTERILLEAVGSESDAGELIPEEKV